MYIAFDTETTGLPTSRTASPEYNWATHWSTCRLVQLAWQVYEDDGALIEERKYNVDVEFTIPESAVNSHGITTAHARSTGIPMKELLLLFSKSIEEHAGVTLVAHNMQFDENVILAEMARLRLSAPIQAFKATPKHCTMLTSTAPGEKYTRLADAYLSLTGQRLSGVHDAAVDARACGLLYLSKTRPESLIRPIIDEL